MSPPFPKEPLIGIVTVLYNSDDVLPDFFASLALQQGTRFRLYVIDNSANDSGCTLSRELSDRHGVDAQIHFNNANVGVAKGNNQGIEMALADGCSHVLLANNDTAFGPHTLQRLIAALADGQDRVVTPKIMYHDEPHKLWYGGGAFNAWTMRTPHYGMKQTDRGQFDHLAHVGYAPTCFMLLDARVFADVGRMDEQYFVYYDDTDFVWRMKNLGGRIRYLPDAVVLHKVSSSTGGDRSPFSIYYTNRNRLYLIRKHLRGLQKLVAISYFLVTRLPRLCFLPHALARKGWSGVADGFRMSVPKT
ncbi:glycosyltransferase family 2 protein [Paucibacter sp. PLA-PC-4]|uniref:glycosyltransferase family 2 protein n=1 Tax=Paucibacter sp. PLA-PC-4 TaxID=2993655 RepID=UPI00224B8DD1|nr:glycosyltransferase family 2 protein [Paucibacter sp. PLA-PC-4]MCX2865136.1 glycosyltransferase family 2 protein [Paucibacter sp. PLA-PC-4]